MHAHEWVLKPSRWYLRILISLLVGSFIVLLALPLRGWVKWVVLFCFSGYSAHLFYTTYLLRGARTIQALRALPDGRWQITTATYTGIADLLGNSTVTTSLSVLRFKRGEQYFPLSCVIFPDSLDSTRYRGLLIALRERA